MVKLISSKKAQYYIIASVILCSLAVMLVTSTMIAAKGRTIFDELKSNFLTESVFVINGAAGSGLDIPSEFNDFIIRFKEYSNLRNVDFGLVSLLLVDDVVYVTNYLDMSVIVKTDYDNFVLNDFSMPTNSVNFSAVNTVTIQKNGQNYIFTFNENAIQLRALFEIEVR